MKLFGTSGIRGIVGEKITPALLLKIGKSVAVKIGHGAKICVGRDARTSSPALKSALISGLVSCGAQIVDIGMVPTPVACFATKHLECDAGIIITASHNPKEYNGIKLINEQGTSYTEREGKKIEEILDKKSYEKIKYNEPGRGKIRKYDITNDYINMVKQKLQGFKIFKGKIMLDPGNGVGGIIIPKLLSELGCTVEMINGKPDGTFPNRSPEPNEKTLKKTEALLKQSDCELAAAFDGDADRVVLITKKGTIPLGEFSAFFAHLRTKKMQNKLVITSIDATSAIDIAIKRNKGNVIRTKVGDTNISKIMRENHAASAVEPCGHLFLEEAGHAPDPIYGLCWLLCQIKGVKEIEEFKDSLPRLVALKEKIKCKNKLESMERIKEKISEIEHKELKKIDGLWLGLGDSEWVLIRPSGTEPIIRLSAEGKSKRIKKIFKEVVKKTKEVIV